MITHVGLNTVNPYSNKTRSNLAQQRKSNITFGQRPEFSFLSYTYKEPLASVFFRRGSLYESQSPEFRDVIKAVNQVSKEKTIPKLLVVGVGKAQEPLSYLAVIKDRSKNKPLESIVDLHCVDLQDKISDEALDKYAFLDLDDHPLFAKESFENVSTNPRRYHYRIKSEILDYLKKTFNNPEKTKWETKIQDFANACKSNIYNIISINNVLLYIRNKKERKQLMDNITRILSGNGILVTDLYDKEYKREFPCLKNFRKLANGIWQKVT